MAAADVEKQDTGGIAVWLITAWFIWVVLLWSTLISAFVMFRIDHGPWEGTDFAVLSVAINGIVASVLAWMSYEAPAFFGGFLAVWLLAGSLAIGAVFPFLDLAAGSNGNPFHSLSTRSIVLTSALSWCAATIGAVLQASLATVFYVQITEQGHAEAVGQVAVAESQPDITY